MRMTCLGRSLAIVMIAVLAGTEGFDSVAFAEKPGPAKTTPIEPISREEANQLGQRLVEKNQAVATVAGPYGQTVIDVAAHCAWLNGKRRWFGTFATAFSAATGTGGMSTLAVSSDSWKKGIAVTTLVLGVLGAFSSYLSSDYAQDYKDQRCSTLLTTGIPVVPTTH